MKQGRCDICKRRWVSDRDMGKAGAAACPSCGAPLRVTTPYSKLTVAIDPNASEEYRRGVRHRYQSGQTVYVG
jgi:hypothetical protein